MTALVQLQKKLAETEQWKEYHAQKGRTVEALACVVRIQAFKEAIEIVKKQVGLT